jgi:hypothetical protein
MQRLLVHAPEGPQIRPERGPSALVAIAVNLAEPIAIRIPRPLVHAVADGGVRRKLTMWQAQVMTMCAEAWHTRQEFDVLQLGTPGPLGYRQHG